MAKNKAKIQNKISRANLELYWQERLTEIVLNIFKWDNLPKEINVNAMIKTIMIGGYGIFFKDKGLNEYFCLGGTLEGVDVYGYYSKATPIAKNGSIIFDTYDVGKDCIIIYANKTRTSALMLVDLFTQKLADVDMAIYLNTKAMKHPIIIKTTEQKKESFESLTSQYDDNWFILACDKQLDLENSLDVINLGVSATEILNLMKEKETILNEFYNNFGVTSTVEKRERVVSGEINVQLQQTAVNTNIWLSAQQEACKQINDLFGLNVQVNRVEYTDTSNEPIEKEGEGNDLHNITN